MIGTRRAVVYLLLVFGLGLALGMLGTVWATRHGFAAERGERGGHSRRSALEWLDSELKLSPEQHRQVEAILDETIQGYRGIRERTRPEYEAVRQQGREKIRAVLNEQQRARFEELVREKDAREAERRRKSEEQDRPASSGGSRQ